MSEPASTPPGTAATFIMALVGTILLMPGICAIVFVVAFLGDGSFSFKDPHWQTILMIWGLCFAVSLCGLLMLRAARRRRVPTDPR
jgi:ABC-type dipeptide/oligopeptide/nickel transport system permease subunit